MTIKNQASTREERAELYVRPSLTVHGTVEHLTAGQGGEQPDTSLQGSMFLDGNVG